MARGDRPPPFPPPSSSRARIEGGGGGHPPLPRHAPLGLLKSSNCRGRGRGRPPHPPAPHLRCAAGRLAPMSFGRASRPERGGGNLGRLNPGEGSQGIAWRFVHRLIRGDPFPQDPLPGAGRVSGTPRESLPGSPSTAAATRRQGAPTAPPPSH